MSDPIHVWDMYHQGHMREGMMIILATQFEKDGPLEYEAQIWEAYGYPGTRKRSLEQVFSSPKEAKDAIILYAREHRDKLGIREEAIQTFSNIVDGGIPNRSYPKPLCFNPQNRWKYTGERNRG